MQHHGRVEPRTLVTSHVGEELRMGEVLAQLVGNMHRQSRLAHTGWSIDGDHRPARHSVGAEHAATEFLGLARTTNEIGHIVRQLSRYSRDS